MRILITEDSPGKLNKILAFCNERLRGADISIAHSYHQCVEMLESRGFDLLLLDMSLPNFGCALESEGQADLIFGGKTILRHIKRLSIDVKVVVVTAYDHFDGGKVSLTDLKKELYRDYYPIYIGTVYFDGAAVQWRSDLSNIVDGLFGRVKGKRR